MLVRFFDLEADNLLYEAKVVHCGVFKDKDTGEVFKFRPDELDNMVKFMDTCDVLIGHNCIDYDFPLLEKLLGYRFKGKKVDSLIMSRVLNPKRQAPFICPNKKSPHSLGTWGYRVGRGKPEHNDWANFSEEMMHRCHEDVEILALVYDELLKEMKGGNWKNAMLLSFRLFENLQKQAAHGWLVDRQHMDFCISQLTNWIRRIDAVITPNLPMILEVDESKKEGEYLYVKKPFLKSGKYSESVHNWLLNSGKPADDDSVCGPFARVSFRRVDLNSNEETKSYLLEQGWIPETWNYDDLGNKTSPKLSKDDPFEGIENKIGKLVAKRVQCRHRRSQIEGLVNLIREDGRISSSVNTLAITGRLTHRNIVNIPRAGSFYGKQLRKIFTCGEGKVIVGTDSDSCQLRMLAGRMGSEKYIDAIVNGDKKKGTDNHSLTMKICDLDSRDTAKTVMYCLLFGGGDPKLGRSAKKPGKGKEVRDKLYGGLDGLEELINNLSDEWKQTAKKRFNKQFNRMEYYDGFIKGLDGRPILVPSEHMLLVYLLQSDESIMMTCAYNMFHKQMEKKGYIYGEHYGTLCFYHDEINVECDIGIADVVKQIAEDSIVNAGKFYGIQCPHLGDAKVGKTWYSVH